MESVSDATHLRQSNAGIASGRYRPPSLARPVSTAWALCRAGVGATLLPLQFVRHTQACEGVVLYGLDKTLQTRQPVIITRRGQYLSPYAAYAIQLLTERKDDV